LFRYRLLQHISKQEQELDKHITEFESKELIYEERTVPELEYAFKHAFTQEATYESILGQRRREFHQQVAQGIERLYKERLGEYYEELAHHYSRSDDIGKAIEYLLKAGHKAVRMSANEEGIGYFSRGLELLKMLPDTPERAQQELTLQLALGTPLVAIKGFGAPELGRVYTRARELCQRIGEAPQLFPALYGLGVFYMVRAEYQTALELGEQLLSLAECQRDPVLLMVAHRVLGANLWLLGQLTKSRAHLEQTIALYDPQQHRTFAFLYGTDSGVHSLFQVAVVLWLLGYSDQARKRSRDALTLAQELSHPFSLAIARYSVAWVHCLRREIYETQEWAEAVVTLSAEQVFPFWLGAGTVLRGWALSERGQGEEGIAQTRQGLATFRATGAEQVRPYLLGLLAEVYGKRGQAEEGLTVLAEALVAVENSGERFWEAELYRIKGELLLMQNEADVGVEEHFRQAIDIAQRQQAKSLELRAAMSLSRLLQRQGRQEEAQRILRETYDWFTEGFDTPDLQDAKMLLEELSLH
jgi:predicted ATPase